ncbi:membrane carboxypeptidase [Pelotomaculum thermopropionicum SI]|uniref:Penicillin-binding protein 1A n=1 Tax=Pelotomaculum thermopropionicum (strain DSM 13744 / JCM 10971 / SI) TaxID=370438 RepID=A5D3I7_PELTS|nr:membrane carboxypeptidase [Pelotomaculum thermopropionicum SI]
MTGKKSLFLAACLFLLATGAGCSAQPFLMDADVPPVSRILDANGELIAAVSRENRIPVKLENVSVFLREAIVAVEDARFYRHHGVDPVGVARALYKNITAGRVVEGGSTITQQLAKNLLPPEPERTAVRKLEELVLAVRLERKYTKDEILEMYLNQIYFGQGAYGVEAAARTYFNKPAGELNLAESAMLAGIPRAPSINNPVSNYEAAKARQAVVLARMAELGLISSGQARQAMEERLQLAKKSPVLKKAPYFVDEVIRHFEISYPNGPEILYAGGLTVYSTLDLKIQRAAEKCLYEGLKNEDPLLDGALVALDPKTGQIKAMAGGKDYSRSQFNRALSRIQPGSAFKPFLYAAAVERGYTAGTVINCEPVSFPQPDGTSYAPSDFHGSCHCRPFTLKEALFTSDNVVAVRLNQSVGPSVTAGYARKMGIESDLRAVPSLALGTSEVTPLEMARAYGTLANGGIKPEPYYIQKVTDSSGRILEERRPQLEKAIDEKTAYIVTDMLEEVLGPGGTASNIAGILDRPAAGKTGTTEEFREAWFVGYTPDLAAAVYVGFDEKSKSPGRSGAQLAAPIWANFMKEALKDVPPAGFAVPPGVVKARICADDGLLAGEYNTRSIEAVFVRGTEPSAVCPGAGQLGPADQVPPYYRMPLPGPEGLILRRRLYFFGDD